MGTIIVGLVVLAVVILIIAVMVRNKRKGRTSCGCDCCPNCGCCSMREEGTDECTENRL